MRPARTVIRAINFASPVHTSKAAIDVAEFSVELLQHGNIGFLADRQRSQLRPPNLVRRIHRGTANDFVQRHTHRQEFGHYLRHAQHGVVEGMQIGRDRVWDEALPDRRNSIAEPEAPRPVADIENHSAGAGLRHDGIDLAIGENDGKLLREHVSMDIARPHLLEQQLCVSPFRTRPEVEHHGQVDHLSALFGPINCSPRRMGRVPGVVGPVVRRLYSNNDVRIFADSLGATLHIHLVNGLFEAAVHAVAHDVQESQHANFGLIDDLFFFLKKRFGAGAARIHKGRNSGLQREVGRNSQRLEVCASVGGEPVERRASVPDVSVDVDEAGRDIQARNIHYLPRLAGGNIFFDRSDLSG